MIEDAQLLRRYAEEKSEAAFAELVRRHVNFVYACALRRVGGDAHLAEDVTQHVFTALARDAAALAQREVLSGWLFTTARNASAQVVRTERRRQARETEAQLMNELTSSSAHDAEWEKLRPVLDAALDRLNDDDRQAVLLRFFEGKSFADVGARLRLNENTARMRVERALDKLHATLARRGVTSTTAALAVALANQAGVAAPAGLAASVTGVALAGGGAAAASAGAWALLMGITKLQVGIVGALAVAGATGYVMQANTNADLRREIAAVSEQRPAVAALRAENQQLASAVAEVELLRRDDVELAKLSRQIADAQQSQRAGDEAARITAIKREEVKFLISEVDQFNKEGNARVEEYKAVYEKSKDPALTPEAKSDVFRLMQEKLDAIDLKERQVKALTKSLREMGVDLPKSGPVRQVRGRGDSAGSVPAPEEFKFGRGL